LIDYDGKLYTELLQKIKPEYKNSNLNKKNYNIDLNCSKKRTSFS